MTRGSTTRAGLASDAELEVAAMVCRGTPVLRLFGRLSRPGLVQCRAAIDNAIAAGSPYLVIDLHGATFDATSVALLGLVRRYCSRRQTTVVLAAVPQLVRDQLRQARVSVFGPYCCRRRCASASLSPSARERRSPSSRPTGAAMSGSGSRRGGPAVGSGSTGSIAAGVPVLVFISDLLTPGSPRPAAEVIRPRSLVATREVPSPSWPRRERTSRHDPG